MPPKKVGRLESFLVVSKTLFLLGDFNTIFDAQIDSIGLTDRRGKPHLMRLLESYSLVDPYRLVEPTIPQWTWASNDGSHMSHLDRLFVRLRDKDIFSCTRFCCVSYMDHKFVMSERYV